MVIKQEVKVEADSDGNSAKIIVESIGGKKVCFIEENVEGYVIVTIAPGYHWGGISGKAVGHV